MNRPVYIYDLLKRTQHRMTRCARLAWVVALAMLAAAPASVAARLDGFYDAEVVVASRSERDLRAAAGAALSTVLVRVTGLRHVPRIPAVREALNAPERFYVQYAYSTRVVAAEPTSDEGDASGGESAGRGAAPERQTVLGVRFDPAAVLELVRRAGLPLWSADRPRILAWVVVEHAGRREMISSTNSRVEDAVMQGVRERGVPITLPLMDIEDNLVTTTDVLGRFWQSLQRAAVRYRPNMVLAAWVSGAGDSWRAEWELRPFHAGTFATATALPATRGELRVRTADAGAVLGALVDAVADELVQRLAVLNRGEDTVRLRVAGIGSPRDYAQLLRFLESREYMDRVEVRMLAPQTVHLMLHSRSSKHQLERLLTIGGMLVPDATSGGSSGTAQKETAKKETAREGTAQEGTGTAQNGTTRNGAARNGAALSDIALRWSGR